MDGQGQNVKNLNKSFFQITKENNFDDYYNTLIVEKNDHQQFSGYFDSVRKSCLSFLGAYDNLLSSDLRPNYMNDKLWENIRNYVRVFGVKRFEIDFEKENGVEEAFGDAFSNNNRTWALRKACKNVYDKYSTPIGGNILSLQHLDGGEQPEVLKAPKDSELDNTKRWNAFVDHIVFNQPPSSSPSSGMDYLNFVGSLFKNSYLKPFQSVLDTSNAEIFLSKAHSSNGQILFSDRPDSTSYFSAGELQATSIDFKKLLKSI